MQVSKILIALTVAAGFASASFAQGTATPSATLVTPAAEKKIEASKAAEPAKTETKIASAKPVQKHAKSHGHKAKKKVVEPSAASGAEATTK